MKVFRNFDWLFFLVIFLLLALGSITIFSVNPGIFSDQIIYVALSLGIYFLFSYLDLKIFESFAKFFYFVSLFFLTTPLFLGVLSRGATRWVEIAGKTFQPSEAAKLFLIVFLARYWAYRQMNLRHFLRAFFLILPQFFLVFRQPDLGSSLVIMAIFFGMILLTEIQWRQILVLLVGFLIILPISWFFLRDYQKERITHFLNPSLDPLGAGYNVIQSVLTVGSGGLTGRGLGKGSQSQLAFLPEKHTDFIFSSFAEAFGFLGSVWVIFLYFLLCRRIVYAMEKTENKFSKYLCAGVFWLVFFQSSVNIGMNLGILPITGITLPLFSYGGSSLLSTMACLGLVENVIHSSFGKEAIEIGFKRD